jgi:hypothetical protein
MNNATDTQVFDPRDDLAEEYVEYHKNGSRYFTGFVVGKDNSIKKCVLVRKFDGEIVSCDIDYLYIPCERTDTREDYARCSD